METLRCLIADIPQKILADIVQTVTQQDKSIEVVGQLSDLNQLSEVLDKQAIDMLILGIQKYTPPTFCHGLLEAFPDLLIVGLVDDGRMAVICIGNVGTNDILKVIRAWREVGRTV